jgi:CubicO group peptidase (beta-lactamase class C family)
VEYIPEFGAYGKEQITIRHLLLHRAGIPALSPDAVDLDRLSDREEVLAIMCEMRPISRPGQTLAYHALTGGFILGEVIHRIAGKDIRAVLADEITGPLGMASFSYGVPAAELDTVAVDAFTGVKPRLGVVRFLERSLGVGVEGVVRIANDPRFLTGIIPSGNLTATANDACRFMELLLRGGAMDGVRVFEERTVRRAVSEQTWLELDRILMFPVRYSLGFMLGGELLSFYGQGTPEAFGHLGFTNVLFWADPERDISVAFLNSGKPMFTPEALAWFGVMRAISIRVPRERLGG